MYPISVVIPTMNRSESLARCLDSVLNQDVSGPQVYEVVVVFDAASKKAATNTFSDPRIKCVQASKPGVNAARNCGIMASEGRVICFIDDDCLLPGKGWIEGLLRVFEGDPQLLAAGGRYLLKEAGGIMKSCRNRLDNLFLDSGRCGKGSTSVLLGGCSAYRRTVFSSFGFFDENIIYGAAETELNDRIYSSKGRMVFCEELSVWHSPPKSGLLGYLAKTFRQGLGRGYSLGRNRSSASCRMGKPWFLKACRDPHASLWRNMCSFLFVLASALSYHSGLFWYRLRHKR